MVAELERSLGEMGVEVPKREPAEFRYVPRPSDLQRCFQLGWDLGQLLKTRVKATSIPGPAKL